MKEEASAIIRKIDHGWESFSEEEGDKAVEEIVKLLGGYRNLLLKEIDIAINKNPLNQDMCLGLGVARGIIRKIFI